jgi:hypothetical protein
MTLLDVLGLIDRFHEGVKDRLWDTYPDNALLNELLQLHAPGRSGNAPACLGCDQRFGVGLPAPWPCSTYEIIARTALGLASREAVMEHLRTMLGELAGPISAGPA